MRFETSSSARIKLSSDIKYINLLTRLLSDFCTFLIFGCLKNQVFRTVLKRAGLEGDLIVCGMKPSQRPIRCARNKCAQSRAGHVTAPGKPPGMPLQPLRPMQPACLTSCITSLVHSWCTRHSTLTANTGPPLPSTTATTHTPCPAYIQ